LYWPPPYSDTTWQRVFAVSVQPAASIRAMAAVRALTAAEPVAVPIAFFTSLVTSVIAVTTSACWPGHSFSSARVVTMPF
jgi:hypothetical protein